jgi:hypothetical protein
MTFLADARLFETQSGRPIVGFVYDHPVDRDSLPDDRTFRTVGFAFLGTGDWIVWVLSSINAMMDEDEATSTVIDIVDGMTVIAGEITPDTVHDLYDR